MLTSDRARRLGAAVLTTVLLGYATGGCNVTTGNPDRKEQRSATERVLETGSVTVDLADPPSREDLGVVDGRKTVFHELPDRQPFEVTVRFRNGQTLTTDATVLGVTTDGSGPPTSLTVRRDGMTMDDLTEALGRAVSDLGADEQRADALLEQAKSTTDGDGDLIRSLPTSVPAPDELTVETVVSAAEGRVSVNYLVRWTG